MASPLVRPLPERERSWLRSTLRERWPHELLVGRGRVREISELLALVAVEGGERVRLLHTSSRRGGRTRQLGCVSTRRRGVLGRNARRSHWRTTGAQGSARAS